MSVLLKRQLNDDEKRIILNQHGRCCFANGHANPEGEPLQFDHIRAFAMDGQSELDNIAPMCPLHNKEKGQLPLFDFRIKLQMREFFNRGDKLTLKDMLKFLKERRDIDDFAQPISAKERDGSIVLESANQRQQHILYSCPITGWKYFYATVPVDLIDSDDDEDEKIDRSAR